LTALKAALANLNLVALPEEELLAADVKAHLARQRALLPQRLTEWGVGSKERRCMLSKGFEKDRTPVRAVVDFLAHARERYSLVLWGPTDTGKSVAAAFWLARAAHRPAPEVGPGAWSYDRYCLFLPAPELERIQRSWAPADKHLMALAHTARALVLDDLGTETGSALAGLTAILLHRDRYDLHTLITTNLDEETFRERYDERNYRRLKDSSAFRGSAGGAS
jgi:DNA replication protein DnaC